MATPKKLPHERKKLGIAPRVPYTPDLGNRVFEQMAAGRDLSDILRDPDMPPRSTFYDWRDEIPDLRAKCARGREALAEFELNRAKRIADECTSENVDVARVQLSHLQWRIPKIAPRTYGDRSSVTTDTTVTVKQAPLDLSALPYEQREALLEVLTNQMKTIAHQPHAEDEG